MIGEKRYDHQPIARAVSEAEHGEDPEGPGASRDQGPSTRALRLPGDVKWAEAETGARAKRCGGVSRRRAHQNRARFFEARRSLSGLFEGQGLRTEGARLSHPGNGPAPTGGHVYELERLRCNLCGEVFEAEAPEGVGEKKYDETAAAMIGLLRYGSGVPWYRLEGLEASLGIPLPAATQWEVVAEVAEGLRPAWEELIRQAAQGEVFYNDDTSMKILALARASPQRAEGKEAASNARERTGQFTSGIVSTRQGQQVALFFTGRRHAGENFARVLAQRAAGLPPPIQMCDALSRNLPKLSKPLDILVGHCNRCSPLSF